MKNYFSLLCTILLMACETTPKVKILPKTNASKVNSSSNLHEISEIESKITSKDSLDENYATYYIIVADTNSSYYILHSKMFELHRKLKLQIDTIGRIYNPIKDLIMLPEDDEDEIYAGEYFSKRFPTESLSLEYLNYYQEKSREKTIALVTGIYEKRKSADSALTILRKIDKKAFKVKAELFVGCTH